MPCRGLSGTPIRRPGRLWIALLLLAASPGCGPSALRTARSDNAFVRCFDLDNDRAAPVAEKQRCWSEWLERYVYNQYDDKLRYAEQRLEALKSPQPPAPQPSP